MEKFVNIEPPPPAVIFEEDYTPGRQKKISSLHQRKSNSVPRKSMEKVISQYNDDDDDLED